MIKIGERTYKIESFALLRSNDYYESGVIDRGWKMKTYDELTRDEKTFMAGCIKTMILANGRIEELELEDLDFQIFQQHMDDFEEMLTAFEEQVKDTEGFWDMAEKIRDKDTRDFILSATYEISLQPAYPDAAKDHFFNQLKEFWED